MSTRPLLTLTDPARHYWRILAGMMTGAWDDHDNLTACVACNSLALVEDLASWRPASDFADLCRQTHEGLQSLRLEEIDFTTSDDARMKIVGMVLRGV